jgi:uncharacterized protein YbaR (Trm112 family)
MKPEESIASELLALLCCPETHQPLGIAAAELVGRLEAQRAAGALRNRAGVPIEEPVQAGLVRADGAVFFPVRAGIPMLVMDEAVNL